MTEAEWEACADPEPMFAPFPGDGSVRKARLLAVACCRRLASFMCDDTTVEREKLLAELERRADELPGNWADTISDDYERVRDYDGVEGFAEIVDSYMMIVCTGLVGGLINAEHASEERGARNEASTQATLVRCTFGNPFRPVALDSAWRTSDVVALAKGIYDDRAFDRLPILADALQDAGCTNDDILTHCRNDGPHARGCWVVDLVLGKA